MAHVRRASPTEGTAKPGSDESHACSFFFDKNGILFDFAVPQNTKVTGAVYKDILRKLRRAIHDKRPDTENLGPIILHDNAPAHIHRDVIALIESWNWEILPHPAYSPDLSPCDYFLFPRSKLPLRGRRFDSVEAINAAFKQSMRSFTKDDFSSGIDSLIHRWRKCVEREGSYIE